MVERTETAFYYPGVIWYDAGWVKSLALFFDEVALLVPDYMRERPLALDPTIAEPLTTPGCRVLISTRVTPRRGGPHTSTATSKPP